jgi:hypothetical protein
VPIESDFVKVNSILESLVMQTKMVKSGGHPSVKLYREAIGKRIDTELRLNNDAQARFCTRDVDQVLHSGAPADENHCGIANGEETPIFDTGADTFLILTC